MLPLCVKGSRKASDLSIFHLEFQGKKGPTRTRREADSSKKGTRREAEWNRSATTGNQQVSELTEGHLKLRLMRGGRDAGDVSE